MSTELPDRAPSYARPYRDPRLSGYGYREDPKLTHDEPDEPRRTRQEWERWHADAPRRELDFDRGLARSLAALPAEQREAVLSREPVERRRYLESLMTEERRESA